MSISGDPFNSEAFFRTPVVFVVLLRMITVKELIHFPLPTNLFLLRSRMFGLTYPIVSFPWPAFAMFVVLTVSRTVARRMLPAVLLL